MNGGGNYLTGTVTANGTANSRSFVYRDYNTFGDVDVAQPHRIQFTFRLDSALTTFTTGTDYVAFYDHPGPLADSSPASSWIIRAHGGTEGTASAKQWVFYNGSTTSTTYSVDAWVNSGISIVPDSEYRFTIDTDPTTKTYIATVENLTVPASFTSGALNFRNYAGNPTAAGSFLHFGARANTPGETLTYSLDSVSVSAIPEPGSVALAISAGLLCCGSLRRRKRRATA